MRYVSNIYLRQIQGFIKMLDFKELSINGQDLEQLVRELLFNLGYKVSWSGRGADGGKDLICIEEKNSIFMKSSRKWLIQCKHKAISGASVGIGDLDEIVSSCLQHNCDAYLLVTSTQPSSGVVERLTQITNNPQTHVSATYWDAVDLERLLSTPETWNVAQRFFPVSATGWQIFASDRPNHWTANFKGYYFQITNRIGSNCRMYLSNIEEKIKFIDTFPLPEGHFFRLRSVYYNDKSGTFLWYIDYMHPHGTEPILNKQELEHAFPDDWNDSYDFIIRNYSGYSDHYDKDHYDYYDQYLGQFILGNFRRD